ncbi:putative DNA-binding protein (MmcQ/YjbR family) [Litorivivens lipolytica]|uniref:Putative DNA-binding protein (MmcQ/YjbR family) n=1 Tax=Litorivivens lipolytica TaxID=1524264 RepID=A0A7W4W7U4_9GAMM|nr:MmcQ/YjbR family DNA-binding protein [Litorivivens lipolytica]MBB3048494.1 putative DNA-binding protein (MmcQ/YjbR family) [Litorivivens lipolytica]
MTREEFNRYCASLSSTTHVVQWGGADVWKVGGKVFAIGGWSKSDSLAVTFKASEHNYEVLKDRSGFQPAPYLASRGMKWIQQTDTSSELEYELKYYIDESHRIVAMGLSKVKRKALGLYQE